MYEEALEYSQSKDKDPSNPSKDETKAQEMRL